MSKRNDCIRDYVKNKLKTNDKWALHALEIVANNQTCAEYYKEETTENNGIGFNGRDAKILTSFSKQYTKRGFLTPNQMIALKKMMPRYWKQIVRASKRTLKSDKLTAMVIEEEIRKINIIPDDRLALHIADKWIFDEVKLAFHKRLRDEQLVLDL